MSDSTPKTADEIKVEIEALRACKPRVRLRNFFGYNLHEAIDAQICVLVSILDEDEIYTRYIDPDNRNELDAALDALAWRDGEEREDAEFASLAEGWLDIGWGW